REGTITQVYAVETQRPLPRRIAVAFGPDGRDRADSACTARFADSGQGRTSYPARSGLGVVKRPSAHDDGHCIGSGVAGKVTVEKPGGGSRIGRVSGARQRLESELRRFTVEGLIAKSLEPVGRIVEIVLRELPRN